MPRGVQQQQMTQYGLAAQRSGQYNKAAQDVAGTMVPTLTSEATNPQGFSIPGLQAMNTASQQSVGGATAGAMGQGNLEAARTRNPGGFTTALDESARSGQRQLSQNALQTQMANEQQRQKQQQAGLAGLERLYGTDIGASLKAFGLGNEALQGASQSAADTGRYILGMGGLVGRGLGLPGFTR